MFGFWFLDPNLNFSLLTARLAASIIAVVFFLPLKEVSHIWLSHIFSGVKFNIKSYSLAELFDPIGALFMLLFGFGWSKRMPYFLTEPDNKSEYIFVCLAGIAFTFFSGVILAVMFNIIALLMFLYGLHLGWISQVINFLIEINVILTVINLLPVPSFDGFKICEAFIPNRYLSKYRKNYLAIHIVLSIMFIFGFFHIPLEIMGNAVYKAIKMLAGLPFVGLRLGS